MQNASSEVVSLIIIISTLLLLFFGSIIVRYIFLDQRKKYQHQQQVVELREAFNQTLLESKLEIQEQTLDHIAKELHANFSHLVSLININLSEILPQSSAQMKENIMETKSLAKQLLSELKALSASLNTDHIIHIGFLKALSNELDRLENKRRYKITLTKAGQEYRLLPEHEIILFRLCQEVLNNILKYAKAKSIFATFHYSPDLFILEIADDGIGFEVNQELERSAEKVSTGLINIYKRARLINGSVRIDSQLGKGTRFTITIPHTQKISQST